MTDLEKVICEIIEEQALMSVENVNYNTRLEEDFRLDSLDLLEVIFAIEDYFDIEIADEDATPKTFGQLCETVIDYLAK